MTKILTKKELYMQNTVAVKRIAVQRNYTAVSVGTGMAASVMKNISRTRYLKFCWHCGKPYECSKFNSYACGPNCSWMVNYRLKRGLNPPANMNILTRVKNVKKVMQEFGYDLE